MLWSGCYLTPFFALLSWALKKKCANGSCFREMDTLVYFHFRTGFLCGIVRLATPWNCVTVTVPGYVLALLPPWHVFKLHVSQNLERANTLKRSKFNACGKNGCSTKSYFHERYSKKAWLQEFLSFSPEAKCL